MWSRFRKKFPIFGLGLLVLALAVWIQLTSNPTIRRLRDILDTKVYDFVLNLQGVSSAPNEKFKVRLVDIDERSIQKVGRWPWSRKTLAQMVENLQKSGVAVVGFDIVFSQPESNIAKELLEAAEKNPSQNKWAIQFLKNRLPEYDYDAFFQKSLSQGENILGFIFHNDQSLSDTGSLPPPLIVLDQKTASALLVFDMNRYRTSIPLLQSASKGGGFVSIIPDYDGVLRKAPLLLRYGNKVFPSLDLEIAKRFLLLDKVDLHVSALGNALAVDSVQIGDVRIPTDQNGQVYIPFPKKIQTGEIVSAVDVLNNQFNKEDFKNALVLMGSSAMSLQDLHATPVDPLYPGLYIHGNILRAILSGGFISRPAWALGVEFVALLVLGLFCVLIFPFLDLLSLLGFGLFLILGVILADYWVFKTQLLIISMIVPVFCILGILLVNIVYGFFFEVLQRQKLKTMFGEYVPKERVELMSENPRLYGFEGESKNLTVLFSDIRNFTTLSEGLSVDQLKELLNRYLTPISECIFKHKGTIDKYVGDMVMAFWGAPISDPDHVKNALLCALEMIEITTQLAEQFRDQKLPEIRIGVGINTGVMNVGDMGSQYRRAYTVLGNAVNLASRLEGLSKEYGIQIVVGEDTQKNQEDFLFFKLDRVKVKGKEIATDIFGLICKKSDITPELLLEKQAQEQALSLYFSGQFTESLAAFLALKKQYTRRQLYSLYAERIEHLIQFPPEGEWTGVFEWKTK